MPLTTCNQKEFFIESKLNGFFFGFSVMFSVSEALLCLCRGTNIYNFWGCIRISRHVPRLFIPLKFF